jgi:PAS domain S-box-containing protein
LKGPEHTFSQANELYLQLAGRRSIVGKTVREVFPEAVGQGIFEIMDKVYQTGEVYTTNEMLIQLDTEGSGKLKDIYLNFMFQPYRNEDKKVDGIFFFGVDVTEQVSMRHEVEKSEARYRQIVETAEEGIWLVNEYDETTFVNKKMSDILQYPVEEIIGKDYSWFSDESTKSIAAAVLRNHRQFRKNSCELKFVSKWGNMIWASLITNSVVDENGCYKGCLAMVTDVTEKKRVADELFKLSLIARNTVNSVYITNPEHKVEWVNESFSRITGYSFADVIGKSPEDFLFGELSDHATLQEIRKSRAYHAPFECEIIKYNKDGKPFWVKEHGQPLFDKEGKFSHYFVMETDITERKHAFKKLQETENEIRMFAAQLNNILETERKRIAREIHDEVGQQLTGLKMLLSSLANMEELHGSARRVVLDMRENLDAARAAIRALATELRPGILDTLGLIPSIEWLAKSFEKKSGIKCSFNPLVINQKFEEKVSITFFRICQEALTNIVKHANASAVIIQMIERPTSLSLKVSDNGTGMDDKKLNDPFSMGLVGMRERAKLINASFFVETNPGAGMSLYLIYKMA